MRLSNTTAKRSTAAAPISLSTALGVVWDSFSARPSFYVSLHGADSDDGLYVDRDNDKDDDASRTATAVGGSV